MSKNLDQIGCGVRNDKNTIKYKSESDKKERRGM
jgi:hypothetical protein